MIKLSVFSVSLPEYNVYETVKVLSELGYDGVEWRVSTPPPAEKPKDYVFEGRYWSYNFSNIDIDRIDTDAEEIKSICEKANLEIPSLAGYMYMWDLVKIERTLKAAVIMGCKNVRVLPPLYNKKENYRTQFDRARTQLKVLEKLAQQYGVRIDFEIHMNYIIPSASAAYRFVEGTDPRYVGIIFDPGNMVHEGFEDYKLGIELLGEYLAHVHIKNGIWEKVSTTEDGTDVWKPKWVPLRKGFVDVQALVGLLKESNYNGYISIEDFSNEEDTYTKFKNNFEYLKKFVAGAN